MAGDGKTTAGFVEQESHMMWGGKQLRCEHESYALGCKMVYSVFLPPKYLERASAGEDCSIPVLMYLSGLTCTDLNAQTKGGFQQAAAEHGIALVLPDTSPRGLDVEGESDSWDFGVGAGFYVNATVPKWKNWRMYEYVTEELPAHLHAQFPCLDPARCSLTGHSMGGHGALTIFFKNPGKYKSVSAFAPICNPVNCPWGHKAFSGYLGDDREAWMGYDACELMKKYEGPMVSVLVDQGTADSFLETQLKPEALKEVAAANDNIELELNYREGYDHSYYFMATFGANHVAFHAKALKG